MAEFAVAAYDLPSGFMKGDIIEVLPNGAVWGKLDGLPKVWKVFVPQVPYRLAHALMLPLWELAIIGDKEYNAPDPQDRRIDRGRRAVRLMVDEVPAAWVAELESVGFIEVSIEEIRPYVRKLRYNRGKGEVVKTNNRAF